MSIPPYCLTVPATSASISGLREMLQAMTVASPPLLLMPAATSSQASALRLEITTLAPSSAQCSAIERPIPRLDPVTIATFPSSPNGDGMAFLPVVRENDARCGDGDKLAVIPEAAKRLSGIHNRDTLRIARLVVMDSGLAPSARPGMTVTSA